MLFFAPKIQVRPKYDQLLLEVQLIFFLLSRGRKTFTKASETQLGHPGSVGLKIYNISLLKTITKV